MSRELDKKIIDAFGYEIGHTDDWGYWIYLDHQDPTLFKPSENMQDAWIVVEKMKEEGYGYCINVVEPKSIGDKNGLANIGDVHCNFYVMDTTFVGYVEFSSEAPMAICLSALCAKGVNVYE